MSATPLTVFAPLARAQSTSGGAIWLERGVSCRPNWAQPATARISPRNRSAGFIGRFFPFKRERQVDVNARRGAVFLWWFSTSSSPSLPLGQPIASDPMRAGEIVFTGMERVVFGRPAADSVAEAADRLGAKRVFILTGERPHRGTDPGREISAA